MSGTSEIEISLVLDSERGWLHRVLRQDGAVKRCLLEVPIAPDTVLALAYGFDYYVPEAAESNFDRSNTVTFVATATHRAFQAMEQQARLAAMQLADIQRRREQFRSSLITGAQVQGS